MQPELERYTLGDEPTGRAYRALLDYALGTCNSALVVVRSADESEAAKAILERLRPYVISERRESRWPGTELLDDTASVVKFRYDRAVADVLKMGTDHLFGWIEPGLPEDLCLIRPDGRPWLVSIAHEHDGYLDLDPGQYSSLVLKVPLRLIRESPYQNA